MYKYTRNANSNLFSHTCFFLRHRFWSWITPSIALLCFLVFPRYCDALGSSNKLNHQINSNPDRTVAKFGPRELQTTTTLSPSILPPGSTNTNVQLDDLSHALYVITLDGKITAIDADDNGRHLWTVNTGSPLVDSSLSKIEISRDSRLVRLIPSLIGGLYEKYDDDGHVEALPFDADALLDASFKVHDDLVITGGKQIDTLGLDFQTGQILYSFSKDDTKQQTTTDHNNSRSTLIVKRIIQTIRARSARSGYEKWNFSVSNHELLYLHAQPTTNFVFEHVDTHKTQTSRFADQFQYQLQTGVVLAFDSNGQTLWSSSINAPIAAVWEYKNGQLIEKSLFEPVNTPQTGDNNDSYGQPFRSDPLAFIGEFNSTPYVLVPPRIQKRLIHDARKIAGPHGNRRPGLLSWQKAYQRRTISTDGEFPKNGHIHALGVSTTDTNFPLALRASSPQHQSTTSETNNEKKIHDNAGYFSLINHLMEEEAIDERRLNSNINLPSSIFTVAAVFVGTLSVILIVYYTQRETKLLRQQSSMTDTTSDCAVSVSSMPDVHQIELPATPSFQSRYTLEYEHVRFLGRGGFGVVFEAINKLDERRVAIKRVSLKKISGKERALKEIRYLAVLNHPNLIQYYYAWNESPPIGWQDEEDKILLVKHNNMNRDSISSLPTSANDSESIHQVKSLRISPVQSTKQSAHSHTPFIDFTFDHSTNPLRIDEDFSNNSLSKQTKSDLNSLSSGDGELDSCDSNNNNQSCKRNRLSTTTKSSLSSSSPFFEHSVDSSSLSDSNDLDDHHSPVNKENTGTDDDGIIFLSDEKNSSSMRQQQLSHSNSLNERKLLLNNDKDSAPTYFYFVMELCQPESLRDRLIKRTIDRHQAWSIFDQIVQGIEYIHSKKLIHRDLKPSNILFSMDNTVKIGDFGLVSAFGDDKSAKKKKRDDENTNKIQPIETVSFTNDADGNNEIGGTILYMSPEQINREMYNQKVDIYAMGIILFELLYSFSTQMERIHALANVRQQSPVFPTDFECDGNNRNQLICRLIRWLLSYSSHDRPKASELRQDTFYQRIVQLEAPHLFNAENRQTLSTIVNGQDLTPSCSLPSIQQRGRVSSSPFRRTVSSSVLQSHRDSESADTDGLS